MPACKPARQCTLLLPSGKRCRSFALRGKAFCHFHIHNHRLLARERFVSQRLDQVEAQVAAMSTAQLLHFLQQNLTTLPHTLARYPEVSYTLIYTLDRLDEISVLESSLRLFLEQNQEFAAMVEAKMNELRNLQTSVPESGI